jgi:hypothetical protein
MTEERSAGEEPKPEETRRKREEFENRTVFTEMFNLFSLVGLLYGALDERLSFQEGMKKQFEKPVWFYRTRLENNLLACLGGISFLLYLFQLVTGILLLMYYRPTMAEAYRSVVDITNHVPYGWLIGGPPLGGQSHDRDRPPPHDEGLFHGRVPPPGRSPG